MRKAIYEAREAVEILQRVEDFFEARLEASALAVPVPESTRPPEPVKASVRQASAVLTSG